MDRRKFLKGLAVTAALPYFSGPGEAATSVTNVDRFLPFRDRGAAGAALPDVQGHTLVSEFELSGSSWKVYEDLRVRDGALTFLSSHGASRVLPKTAEATFAGDEAPYLGLSLRDVGMSGPDLLAERLLKDGDPNPELVKIAAPPLQSALGNRPFFFRLPWDTFVGTRECFDTMPVFPTGNTRTYHPNQYFPEINERAAQKRWEGLLGGWMPAVRKVLPISDTAYYELIVFGDVEAHDKFIVQTWHRTARIDNGKVSKVVYGHSYPSYPPRREAPAPEEFYRALLVFSGYWEKLLHDFAPLDLPEPSWTNMAKYAFVKELMVRPGGVYPKYGAVDRDYYGSEYDGFQDIFTMAAYANLELGRFEMAKTVIDNYFTDYVDSRGMINMRGPETAQFGMELMLLAKYFSYTGDAALLEKHKEKVQATASLLTQLHDLSLRLPEDDPGYGLIHGWCESDSCLGPKPMTWWLPYYSNSAFAARGLKAISQTWREMQAAKTGPEAAKTAADWEKHSLALREAVVGSMGKNVQEGMNPPYIGPFPGAKGTFWESMRTERPSPQQWVHRAYAELLQADVLPAKLANLVIDCMRAYGATTLGVLANVEPPHPTGRDILGFISYGYAQMLLRLDRIEEYLLFLYAHRYHDHTRGSWTAGEVSGITGGSAIFCIPAQQTIPLLVRWMLVSEDSDEDILHYGRAVPREWSLSGKEISIREAPTRWGRTHFKLQAHPEAKRVSATVELTGTASPKQMHVKFRLPLERRITRVISQGKEATIGGAHNDTAILSVGNQKRFDLVCEYD